jgi:hypothetical protein
VIEHRGLGEGALRSQERDLERLLLRKTRRHDLAEQAHHFRIAQRTRRCARAAQDLCLALGR